MQARIKNPATIAEEMMAPLVALGKTLATSPVPEATRGLIHLRTGQINGCAVCIDLHVGKTTETPRRLAGLAAWRESPFFSEAERAALALAEAVTELPVSDEVWAEAARHYDERQLAWLVIESAVANLYNRINVATRQVAGQQRW